MRDDAVKIEGILEDSGFPHAACGAVAMAMHGMPRASVDLDFVVHPSIIDKVRKELRNLGFTYEPGEMTVAKGRIKIHRFVRLVAGKEPDVIDFLLAESGSVCERVLATAIQRDVPGPGGRIFRVLSMPGLMELKSLSDRDQDHADAETLRRRIEFDAE